MDKFYLVKAIKSLRPESEFSFTDNDYSTIKWHILDGNAPTVEEIELEIDHLKAIDAQTEQDKAAAKESLLNKLGITAEEAVLLLS